MSGSTEERDRARSRGRVGLQAHDDVEAPPPEQEEVVATVDLIRRIAEDLDVSHLNEEKLRAVSEAALSLVEVAKAQDARNREISFQRAQVEDWEARHAEAIAGAEIVTDALAALKTRVDEGGMDREGVSAALDLVERWLSVDANYRATHEKLKQASIDADFESVRSLIDALEGLAAERREVCASVDALAKLGPVGSTPEKPACADRARPSDPATPEHAPSLEEPKRLAGQPAPSVIPSEDAPKSATEKSPAASDEDQVGQSLRGTG